MTIKGTLGRFALIYILSMFIAGLALSYFEIDRISGLNIGIIMGAIYWVCNNFIQNNKRYFTDSEKTKVIIGFIIIDILILTFFSSFANWFQGLGLSSKILFFSLGVSILLHSAVIWFWVGYTKKLFIKAGTLDED